MGGDCHDDIKGIHQTIGRSTESLQRDLKAVQGKPGGSDHHSEWQGRYGFDLL